MTQIYVQIACFLLVCSGCQNAEPIPTKPVVAAIPPATGITMVYDLTRSNTYLQPDDSTVVELLYDYAFHGVYLTGLHILSDSQKQQPWLSPYIGVDTLPLPNNFILAAKQLKRNQEAIRQAREKCAAVARQVGTQLFLPQEQDYSDVTGALRLAAKAAHGYAEKGIRPVVIIISDLIQDLEPGIDPEPIPAIDFPPDTEIILIGADPSVSLPAIFGQVKIRELPSFQHLTI